MFKELNCPMVDRAQRTRKRIYNGERKLDRSETRTALVAALAVLVFILTRFNPQWK